MKKEEKIKERELEKKGNFSKIIIAILLIVIAGLVGYICGTQGLFDSKPAQEQQKESAPDKQEQEALVEGYQFNLKDKICEKGEHSCTKKLKVAYNGKNHDIKIVDEQKIKNIESSTGNTTKRLVEEYTLYIDNKLVDTIDAIVFYSEGEPQYKNDRDMNFDGYIYVFEGKYLGFVYGVSHDLTLGHDLRLYNDGSIVAKDISVDAEGQSFGINGSEMDKINNLEFDGTTLKYWYLSCDDRETETALKLGLTFDGANYKINVLDKMTGVTGGGAATCYSDENSRYGG